MPHLDEYLSQELGAPVEVGDPLKSLNVKVTSLSDRYIKEVSPLFSVCVGLAIRDMIG
jgi:Tfp pilus assembly PilM family ATPase